MGENPKELPVICIFVCDEAKFITRKKDFRPICYTFDIPIDSFYYDTTDTGNR